MWFKETSQIIKIHVIKRKNQEYTYKKLLVGVLLLHKLYNKNSSNQVWRYKIPESAKILNYITQFQLDPLLHRFDDPLCTLDYRPVVVDILIKRSKPVSPQKLSKKTEMRFIIKFEREVVS